MKADPNAAVTNKRFEKAINDLSKKIDEAVDAMINGMQKMHDEQKQEFQDFKKFNSEEHRIIEKKLDNVPSRKEFESLKRKVYRHHPSN